MRSHKLHLMQPLRGQGTSQEYGPKSDTPSSGRRCSPAFRPSAKHQLKPVPAKASQRQRGADWLSMFLNRLPWEVSAKQSKNQPAIIFYMYSLSQAADSCHHCLTQTDLTYRRPEDLLALLKAPCSRCGRPQQVHSQIQGLPN